MSAEKRLTNTQIGVLAMLRDGYSVYAVHCPGPPFWRAQCEYLPVIKISTLRILERRGLVRHDNGESLRVYEITGAGLCVDLKREARDVNS